MASMTALTSVARRGIWAKYNHRRRELCILKLHICGADFVISATPNQRTVCNHEPRDARHVADHD